MMIGEMDALFLARAVESFRRYTDDSGSIDTVFEVIESFKGNLKPRSRVMVTGSLAYDMCGRSFSDGRVYLVQATVARERMHQLRQNPRIRAQLSSSFLRSAVELTMYYSFMCHGTRLVQNAEHDVPILRKWKAGMRKPFLLGVVNLHHFPSNLRDTNADQLPGARVRVGSGDHVVVATTSADGRFQMDGLEEGGYDAVTSSPGYREITVFRRVLVPKTGCGYYLPTLSADAGISGIVLDHRGRPVEGVEVEALRIRDDGHMRTDRTHKAITDSAGRFRLWPLPDRMLVLAVNHANRPNLKGLWSRSYYPGVRKLDASPRLELRPSEFRRDLVFVLPPPASARAVKVHVEWKNGERAANEMVVAYGNGRRTEEKQADAKGDVHFHLLSETEYEFRVWRYGGEGNPVSAVARAVRIAEGNVILPAGGEPVSLRLILEERERPWDW